MYKTGAHLTDVDIAMFSTVSYVLGTAAETTTQSCENIYCN